MALKSKGDVSQSGCWCEQHWH